MTHWTLRTDRDRIAAIEAIDTAPDDWRVEVREPKRSDIQNDRMWAMIGDVMKQLPDCFGPGLDKDDHKQVFMAALFKELRMATNVDGNGYVPLTRRSSNLSVREMANLITLIDAWGTQRGIQWSDPAIVRENPRETA